MVGEKIKAQRKRLNTPAARAFLEGTGFFLLGLLLSLGRVMGEVRPFGVALVCITKKKRFLFAAAGALLGYLSAGLTATGVRYLAAVLLAGLAAFAAAAFNLDEKPAFPMTAAFLADFVTGCVLNLRLGAVFSAYLLTLGEAVLCCGGAFFFFKALAAGSKRLRFRALPLSDITCIMISCTVVLLNLSSFYIGILCPARLFAMLAILLAIRFFGDRWGCILALCCGFSFSIAENGAVFILGALAFAAMTAGLFAVISPLGTAMSFLSCIGFFAVASDSGLAFSVFAEAVIACVLFLLMPTAVNRKLEAFAQSGRDAPPDGSLRQSLVLKLRFASSAMAAISESVEQVREKINDITRRENERCREHLSTEELMRREIILEKTNQLRSVASDQFFSIAGMLEDLAFEFDEAERFDAASSAKIRRLLGAHEIFPKNISVIEDKYGRMRVEILTDAATAGLDNPALSQEVGKICSRYFERGKITNFKNETMLSFFERPLYKLDIGFAQRSAEGKLCGDTIKILGDNKGHATLIISDGMGKGSRAALDGAMGAGLLSKLINAGFGFDSALKVVNSALLVKSNDESLATLDIASVDLFTGKCEFFKAGAPAGYIIKGESLNKCELSSMPAGILRGVEFAKRTAVLSPQDAVVLMSDGITEVGEEPLEEILHSVGALSAQASADGILSRALQQLAEQKKDDMSVIFAKMERNE